MLRGVSLKPALKKIPNRSKLTPPRTIEKAPLAFSWPHEFIVCSFSGVEEFRFAANNRRSPHLPMLPLKNAHRMTIPKRRGFASVLNIAAHSNLRLQGTHHNCAQTRAMWRCDPNCRAARRQRITGGYGSTQAANRSRPSCNVGRASPVFAGR